MAVSISLTPRVQKDLSKIRAFFIKNSPQAADSVRSAINHALNVLAEQPRVGRHRPELNIHSFTVRPYLCTIYYRPEPTTIIVLHVRDNSRRLPITLDL